MMPAQDVHDQLNAAAEVFLKRLRRGETPSISEYAEQYPELADDIRELFPTLAMVEGVGERAAEENGATTPQPSAAPRQLGDYHIVREIGRGGMGVVYEAYQKPLGRKVALKVLGRESGGDRVRLLRFQREARMAARLHHTNIVPVHEVGVRDSVHYYSMQFIEGQGLDAVWSELRNSSNGDGLGTRRERTTAELTRQLANGLLTEVDPRPGSVEHGDDHHDEDHGEGAPPTTPASCPVAAADSTTGVQNLIDTAAGSRTPPYYRNVARVALQVVEALAYAHSQGVLHRDIKPSNVILDTRGRAWVTDFGLAKKLDDELTQPGDIVGTLRYMGPERFNGPGDERSDVYSAGITLYEFLTLRPAYAASDRASLLQQIQQSQPPRPRKVEPAVPRDLETIVLKAIDKDPKRRYQTAATLGEDLERFLEDRPIVARRTSAVEHAWRWCRRNRAVAALTAGVVALLATVMLIVFIGLSRSANVERQHAKEAGRLKRLAEQRLLDSYRNEADAWRWSRGVGQRSKGLKAIRGAAALLQALDLSDAQRARLHRELADAAVHCLGMRDLQTVRKLPRTPPGTAVLGFDHELARYAIQHRDGRVTIHSLSDGGQLAELESMNGLQGVGRFSPDGRFLLVTPGRRGKRHAHLFDLDTSRRVLSTEVHFEGFHAIDYTRDSQRVAISRVDKTVGIYDVKSGELLESIDLKQQNTPTAFALRFSPDDTRLAMTLYGTGRVRIWNLREHAWERRDYEGGTDVDWSPDGTSLATATGGNDIFVWDLATGQRRFKLQGHQKSTRLVGFSPRGEVLASYAWEGRVWLWNARTGTPITHVSGQLFGFNAQGEFAYTLERQQTGHQITVGKLLGGEECSSLSMPLVRHSGKNRAHLHPGGRLLVAACIDGVRLRDLESRRPLGYLTGVAGKRTQERSVIFTSDGKHLITSGDSGVKDWPITVSVGRATSSSPGKLDVQVGEPITLYESRTADKANLSRDGTMIVVLDEGKRGPARLITDSDWQRSVFLIPGDSSHVAISPDGRWAVMSCRGAGVRIWDTRTSKLLHELPASTTYAALTFSPDGRHLVTTTEDECRFWESGTWRSLRAIPRSGDTSGHNLSAVFSRDGKLLAMAYSRRGAIKLIRTDTFEDLATLEPPSDRGVDWLHFTPDGQKLLSRFHVWDLRLIGKRLREMKLDWKVP